MATARSLRGGCHCGRNQYAIAIPDDGIEHARVHFNTDSNHRASLATPLAAFIRVPLTWYQSTTYAFFPDETHSSIRRVYEHLNGEEKELQRVTKKHFCGYCGTPLSFWSEEPPSEAEFIHLTLGSLDQGDLQDLEDMGLIPGDSDDDTLTGDETKDEPQEGTAETNADSKRETRALRQTFGVSWLDTMMRNTKLGKLRHSHGGHTSDDGNVQVSWEVVEFTDGGDQDTEMEAAPLTATKRKLDDRYE